MVYDTTIPYTSDGQQQRVLDRDPRYRTLGGILNNGFLPEFQRLQGNQSELEDLFMQMLRTPTDFNKYRGELSAVAESLTNEMFGAGGAVEKAYGEALGQTVETGFGTNSGGFDRARNNILGQARDTVANTIAQNAINIAPIAEQSRAQDIASMLGFTQYQGNRADSLRESLFGGQATIDQQGLANEQMDLNRRLVEESIASSRKARKGGFLGGLGRIAGGIAGSILGPAGASVGGAVGDALGGDIVGWLGLGDSGGIPRAPGAFPSPDPSLVLGR